MKLARDRLVDESIESATVERQGTTEEAGMAYQWRKTRCFSVVAAAP
jgi:hypothetical protein